MRPKRPIGRLAVSTGNQTHFGGSRFNPAVLAAFSPGSTSNPFGVFGYTGRNTNESEAAAFIAQEQQQGSGFLSALNSGFANLGYTQFVPLSGNSNSRTVTTHDADRTRPVVGYGGFNSNAFNQLDSGSLSGFGFGGFGGGSFGGSSASSGGGGASGFGSGVTTQQTD